jgi:hypothetical protein
LKFALRADLRYSHHKIKTGKYNKDYSNHIEVYIGSLDIFIIIKEKQKQYICRNDYSKDGRSKVTERNMYRLLIFMKLNL